MAEGDIGAEIDSLQFEAGTCVLPKLVHVAGDIFAIAYQGPDGDGWIKTVEIDSAGAIPAAVEGSLEFDTSDGYDPDIIKVTSGVFAVVYRAGGNDGWIKTLTISDDGATLALTGQSFEFDAGACYLPRIVKVADNVFAVVYSPSSFTGFVVTIGISSTGDITDPILDSLTFNATRCVAPHITHVVGDFFAIAYQGPDDDGWVTTVEIDSAGAIAAAAQDSLEFDAADIEGAHILRISATLCVIAYKNADGDGDMVTISIDAAGDIGAAVLDDQEFDAFNGIYPCIIHVSGDMFAIAYEGTGGDGWLRTWSISDVGVISATEQDNLEYDIVAGDWNIILHISGSIYAIVYSDGSNDGQLISVDIETVAAAAATQHLPLMGIG